MTLFCPTYYKKQITDLLPEELQMAGIRGLLLDVDNTLSKHWNHEPLPGVREWLDTLHKAGIVTVIVSNARESRVRPFAEQLQIPYFSLCKKPFARTMRRGIKQLGLKQDEVLLCGDQLFTDMLGGNHLGVRTLLVEPAEPERAVWFKIRRFLERPFLRKYRKNHNEFCKQETAS